MKKNKFIIICIAISLSVLILLFLFFRSRINNKNFYEKKIEATVIKSNDWQKRSIDFILYDGTTLNFIEPVGNKIKVGDSIFKPISSYIFEVYRQNKLSKYEFYKKYDYLKAN